MCLSPELQEPLLLELHLRRQAVRGVVHMHDPAVVDTQLPHDNVVNGSSDLQALKLSHFSPSEVQSMR